LGVDVSIQHLENPRKELEEHYYSPAHSGLLELGLIPHLMTDEVLAAMLEQVLRHRNSIVADRILPRVRWR
jgi:UDP-sulfoquinovose synthase